MGKKDVVLEIKTALRYCSFEVAFLGYYLVEYDGTALN